jgi:glutamine---fructose-6-phosphate transaminase (isomerizing)
MCGIFGIVTHKEQALGPILTEAAQRLTYRGYDSVGAATFSRGRIDLRKDAGRVQDVAAKYNFAEMSGSRGITQLRWATFGEPSQVNSQPHLDSDGDLVGAHNGNVVNNVELRQQFMAEGMTVRSMNDGESCVHAVERYVDQGFDMIESIRRAYGDLQGDYSFVIGRINDDRLYAIKKGSGLVVGIGEDFTCISSDLPSILPLTRKIMRLNDGEIITLWHDKVELHTVKHGPLSAVSPGFPILFAAGPQDVPLIVSGLNEVTCRGAHAIAIGQEDQRLRDNASDMIVIPDSTPEIMPLLAVLPLQLLSYHMSVLRGYDPDFPRNLSKTLTVD